MTKLKDPQMLADPRLAMVALAEGNIGAVTAMMAMADIAEKVDPDSALGMLDCLFSLDNYCVYGTDIWVLFKYVCCHNPVRMIAVLRACQLGLLGVGEIRKALSQAPSPERTALKEKAETIVSLVQEKLPEFAKEIKDADR